MNYRHFFTKNSDGKEKLTGTDSSVAEVLDFLSNGMSFKEITQRDAKLTLDHLYACSVYASERYQKLKSEPLDTAIESLQENSRWLNWGGAVLLLISIGFGLILFADIKNVTNSHIPTFVENPTNYSLLTYLIVRSSALGVIATTILIFSIRTAVACFDQAARFAKRRNGALFLKYLYNKYERENLDDKKGVEQIIAFFDAWNQNIESAFSSVKVDKNKSTPLEIKIDKDGAFLRTGNESK